MRLRKLLFVLPNLFTVSSIFCGFYAITLCTGEAGPVQLYQAALALCFAVFFDGMDGRVARLTRTQSQFGMELDSLADVVSFGVAPALLVWRWALEPMGFAGLFLAFGFAACGALRLARFNVLAQRSSHGGGGAFFVGLPIPLAACALMSFVVAHHVVRGGEPLPDSARGPVAAAVVGLSLLLVSTVRYRTFKDLRLSARSAPVLALVLGLGVLVATRAHPAMLLVLFALGYLAAGLVESAVGVGMRRVRVAASARAPAVVLEAARDDEASRR